MPTQAQSQYLDFSVYPSFQEVNRLFVLSFENITDRLAHTGHFYSKVELKYCNIIIDWRKFFD